MKLRTIAVALLLVLLAVPAAAQIRHPPRGTVAELGACGVGTPRLRYVTNGQSATDCSVGGGSTEVLCRCEGGVWVSGGGSGTSVILDLGNNATNESLAITKIATTEATPAIFTEPLADVLLIDTAQPWPVCAAGDSATAFFSAGTIEALRLPSVEALTTSGGAGTAPLSGGAGALSMVDVTTQAELTTHTGNVDAHHARDHAASHKHAGIDEVATATPAANAIPKAGIGGTIADGWLSSNVSLQPDADTTCLDAGVTCLFAGSVTEGGPATTAAGLQAGAIDALTDFAAGLCGTNAILEDQGATWACITTPVSASNHNLLSSTHPDTTPAAVLRGALVIGQGVTPTWSLLGLGATATVLRSNGTDAVWSAIQDADLPATITRDSEVPSLETDPGVPLLALSDLGDLCAGSQATRRNAGDTATECFTPFSPSTLDTDYGAETITSLHDFTTGTLRLPNSITLPAACTIGNVYVDTDVTPAGQQVYICSATNVWSLIGDGGGGGDIEAVGNCTTGSCFVDGVNNGSTLTYEGATIDTNQTALTFSGDPAGAFTVTVPNETGTLCTTAAPCSGYQGTIANYVATVADGTGIDGTASGVGSTYTPVLDLTEINDHTWGNNSDTSLQMTFDPTGITNPRWDYTDGNVNLAVGTLQSGGLTVSTGAHFSPSTLDTDYGSETIASSFDFTSGTLRIPNSITLPATCTVGNIYADTDLTPAGQQVYVCSATNVWSLIGDGGGAGAGDIEAVGNCVSGSCFTDGVNNGSVLVYEGATVDANQTSLTFTGDPAGVFTVTIPNESGTVCTTGSVCAGYQSSIVNYVGTVADGTGVDGTATGAGSTYTPVLDLTEINDHTWGNNSDITISVVFDPTGTGNPTWQYTDGVANLSSGALQVGGSAVSTGVHATECSTAGCALNSTSTATTAAADDNDTSVSTTAFVQQEINGAGGALLTCSGGVCGVDAELSGGTFSFVLEAPATGDNGQLQHSVNRQVTITRVQCSTDAGTVTININERVAALPNTTGADSLSAGLVCDTNSQSSCASGCDVSTIQNQPIDAADPIALEIDAVSGAGWLRVHVSYTVDDV